MIKVVTGDIFESDAQALVNPVNCVGTMGVGLAKQFKNRYPGVFKIYKQKCDHGLLEVGRPQFIIVDRDPDKYVINFPTKDDWRNPSKIQWIEDGIKNLEKVAKALEISPIAVPMLGCGLGGLSPEDVMELYTKHLKDSPVEFIIYRRKS